MAKTVVSRCRRAFICPPTFFPTTHDRRHAKDRYAAHTYGHHMAWTMIYNSWLSECRMLIVCGSMDNLSEPSSMYAVTASQAGSELQVVTYLSGHGLWMDYG
ncbi:predicted protein [Plenodomus lingam JN3]|uniref:Predicted protein n=1 Tax=Leptosphaeria maculans (strain JN3 / isolate v23.1.3 / race Av1-4-5-6-7-8) TaxID=985895 RepID=E5ACP8_LEPMJ|nr:predicted protein [Plenodomus lingam JN3]CBY02250.1 predicted protein [Plenodomus lingam JN3]